jgi:OmpA-OmpF porin, OOP family
MIFKSKLFALILTVVSFSAFAQEGDLEGSKDHPMLSRMSNFFIGEYETNYDRVEMWKADGAEIYIEGEKTYLYYFFDENSGKKNPSPFQIVKNYENAIKRIGGKVIYTDNEAIGTYMVKKDGQETWVKLQVVNSGYVYYLTVVEKTPMEQEINAAAIFDKLNSEGSVALYINFDSGKSTITADSQNIIEEIVKMLKENEDLTISIEGHTDNVGTPAANKALSLNRAKSVMTAITTQGIPTTRMKAAGWGQEKPIADNATEEGKAQNRRVEIVKI